MNQDTSSSTTPASADEYPVQGASRLPRFLIDFNGALKLILEIVFERFGVFDIHNCRGIPAFLGAVGIQPLVQRSIIALKSQVVRQPDGSFWHLGCSPSISRSLGKPHHQHPSLAGRLADHVPAGAGHTGGVGAAAHDQIHRQGQELQRLEVAPPAGHFRLAFQVGVCSTTSRSRSRSRSGSGRAVPLAREP